MRRVWPWAAALLCLAGGPSAGRSPALPIDDGWQEAVVSVADLDDRVRSLTGALGWQVVHRGTTDPRELRAWGLPEGASAEEALLAQPGSDRGAVRLLAVSGAGADLPRIRSSAQPWEAGGWSGLNVRVKHIDAVFRALQRAGFNGFSDPVQFDVAPYTVREAMMTGPDGLVIGLLERVTPPFDGFDWGTTVSHPVTAFSIVSDTEASGRFLEALGLHRRLEFSGPAALPGMNLFGLPHDVAARISRRVEWRQAAGREEGTIATVQFERLQGRHFGAAARPPNLGLTLLRMPVADAAKTCALAPAEALAAAPHPALIEPYGAVSSCVVVTPDGAWIEFISEQAG